MIYELRVYYCVPGRLPNLLKRFDTITLKLWEKHGIKQAGFWTVLVGEFEPGPLLPARLGQPRGPREEVERLCRRSGVARRARQDRGGRRHRRQGREPVPAADEFLEREVGAILSAVADGCAFSLPRSPTPSATGAAAAICPVASAKALFERSTTVAIEDRAVESPTGEAARGACSRRRTRPRRAKGGGLRRPPAGSQRACGRRPSRASARRHSRGAASSRGCARSGRRCRRCCAGRRWRWPRR